MEAKQKAVVLRQKDSRLNSESNPRSRERNTTSLLNSHMDVSFGSGVSSMAMLAVLLGITKPAIEQNFTTASKTN
jgi:hypothetical protein